MGDPGVWADKSVVNEGIQATIFPVLILEHGLRPHAPQDLVREAERRFPWPWLSWQPPGLALHSQPSWCVQ